MATKAKSKKVEIQHRYKDTAYLRRLHKRVRKARRLKEAGKTYAEIAEIMHTTSTTILRYVLHSSHVTDIEE